MVKKNPTEEIAKKVSDLKDSLYDLMTSSDIDSHNKVLNELLAYLEEYDWRDVVFDENGKKGLKDYLGNIIAPAIFDEIIPREDCFSDVQIPACIDGRWGVIPANADIDYHREGFVYDGIEVFWGTFWLGGVYKVKLNNLFGLIDDYGIELMPCVADEVYPFSNGMALVVKNGKYGFLTDNYDYIEPTYDEIEFPEIDEYYKVRQGDKWGYVDKNKQFTLGEDKGGEPSHYGCFYENPYEL